MERRRLLAGVAAGLAGGLAGCTALGSGRSAEPVESDRPLVDETFVAGPTDQPCESSGKTYYPPMRKRTQIIDAVPESTDAGSVGAFVRDRIRVDVPVALREDRYARLAWRDRVWNITDRYGSEQHYVGEIRSGGGRSAILVVVHASHTKIVRFDTAENC